jgi:hypothetical protein
LLTVQAQAIGLPILPTTRRIMKSISSDIKNSFQKIVLTEKQMDQLYDLAIKYKNKSIRKEEFILELRGGGCYYFYHHCVE